MQLLLISLGALVCALGANASLPTITLPWGTWQASSYDEDSKFYTFSNIRFGRPTDGSYRFNPSAYPANISHPEQALQKNSYGPSCIQIDPRKNCSMVAVGPTSEDCLFLDVYVPRSAFESGAANTPVVVWFFGGAFLFGSKNQFGAANPFYTGQGLIEAAAHFGRDLIFVAGNYRLGAFGWLAGPSVEADGRPNAGLYDQRLLLEWVRDFIHLFGGDRARVSAWGESAGAGSLVHHLLRQNGTQDPLFRTAVLQSPAHQWQWDRSANGTLEAIYANITQASGCTDGGMACLRKVSTDTLTKAAQDQYDHSQKVGLFPFGPAIDDIWLSSLPPVAFDKDRYWKDIQAMIISHVGNEAGSFIPPWVKKPENFTAYLEKFMPEDRLAYVRAAIEQQYPSSAYLYDEQLRVGAVIRDSTFTCNTRFAHDAYAATPAKLYMMAYNLPDRFNSHHGSDLLPTFWYARLDVKAFLEKYLCLGEWRAGLAAMAMQLRASYYQSYLASFAVFGDPSDPNAHGSGSHWAPATTAAPPHDDALRKVLRFGLWDSDADYVDDANTHSICNFWVDVAYNVTKEIRKDRRQLPPARLPGAAQAAAGKLYPLQQEL